MKSKLSLTLISSLLPLTLSVGFFSLNGNLNFYFSEPELSSYNKITTKPREEKAVYTNDHPIKYADLDIELNFDYNEIETDTLDHVEWMIYAFQNGLFLLRDQDDEIVKRYFINEKGYKSFSLQVRPPCINLLFSTPALTLMGLCFLNCICRLFPTKKRPVDIWYPVVFQK